MRKKRIATILAAVLLVLAGAAYHYLFGYVVVQTLEERVSVLHRKNILNQIGANVLVYSDSRQTIVVDTQLAPLASSTRSRIESLLDVPISKVIVTHWHPDHSGGIAAYSSDVEVMAHRKVLQRLSKSQEGFGLTKPGSHHEFDARTEESLPNAIVDNQIMIKVAAPTIEIAHYPNAHTDGDLVVFFDGPKVVALGDLVWPESFPFIDVHNGGTVMGLQVALEAILERTESDYTFVPGHGAAVSYNELVDYLGVIRQSRQWVEPQQDQGQSLSQMIASGLPEHLVQWESSLVPADVWITMIYESNIDANIKTINSQSKR